MNLDQIENRILEIKKKLRKSISNSRGPCVEIMLPEKRGKLNNELEKLETKRKI